MAKNQVNIKIFSAKDCDVCELMKPQIKKLKKNNPKWKITSIDVDKNPKKAKGIEVIPVIKICVGNKCSKTTGGMIAEDIEKIVGQMNKLNK